MSPVILILFFFIRDIFPFSQQTPVLIQVDASKSIREMQPFRLYLVCRTGN